MQKKLTRHGNSLALIIDRPILELLRIEPDTPLELSTDGDRLIITPVGVLERGRKLDRALRRIVNKYDKTFRKLAE